jgi:prevent-host-death family protein
VTKLTITQARDSLADVVGRAHYAGERTVISRNGHPVAAIVSTEDLALLEAIENEIDVAEVRKALNDPANARRIARDEVRARLG